MPTPVLPCSPEALTRAARILRDGGLVAFPTETVYGLGAHALDSEAVGRIFAAKGRPATNPVIVHIADIEQLSRLTTRIPDQARLLAEQFWPGPLTIVLPRAAVVPDVVTAGGPTVAVRIPSHPQALALLREAGIPIAAPSANRSNRLSPTRAEHVFHDLNERIDLILDDGPTLGGIESTVVDVTSSPVRLLRPGLIDPASLLEAIIGPVLRSGRPAADHTALPSPGMLARHYAPRTPLEIADDAPKRVAELRSAGLRVALLGSGAEADYRLPDTPEGYAAGLFATLHELDKGGFDRIVAANLPEGDEWLGVRDRLTRAATPE